MTEAPLPPSEDPPVEPPRRVSPVTPLLNAWKVATALVAFAVWQGRDLVVEEDLPFLLLGGIFLGLLLVSTFLSLLYNYFAWRRLSYGFDAESIYVHSGILFRTQRHVRLDRIQSVDLNRPLLARIFGYVSLQVVSAGSVADNLAIAFVKDDEAHRLRNEILARAAGLTTQEDTAPAPQAPERELYRVSPLRIFGSLIRSGGLMTMVVLTIALIAGAIILRDISIILAVALPMIGSGTFWWRRITQIFDFTVATSPDGIRLRYGLLSTVSRTVPPGRVQAISLTQPLLWRRKNWWRILITVAGEGSTAEAGEPMLYPVATQAEAADLLYLILPDLGVPDPLATIDTALRGSGPSGGFTTSPRSARWVDPIVWRRTGYLATNTATIIRRGRIIRTTDIVPNARIQSIGAAQGPIERRLGLASVTLHTTPGSVSANVPHLAAVSAREFIADASHRAGLARRAAGPERWMETPAEEPDSPEPAEPTVQEPFEGEPQQRYP